MAIIGSPVAKVKLILWSAGAGGFQRPLLARILIAGDLATRRPSFRVTYRHSFHVRGHDFAIIPGCMGIPIGGLFRSGSFGENRMMQKVLCVLLAGGVGERLYPLTRERAKPSVPFGGVYRIIDITLSNCINSN